MVPPASALAASAVRHREHLAAAAQARRTANLPAAEPTAATILAAWRHTIGAALVRLGRHLQRNGTPVVTVEP